MLELEKNISQDHQLEKLVRFSPIASGKVVSELCEAN